MKHVALILCAVVLGGCSVFMAASGSKEIDLSTIRIGRSTRPQVEQLLGKPITFYRKSYGDEATYQFFTGDEPSYTRALMYAGLDVVTVLIAEIFTSPIESLQGDRHLLKVLYTPSGVVKDVEHQFNAAPLPNPNKVIAEQLE